MNRPLAALCIIAAVAACVVGGCDRAKPAPEQGSQAKAGPAAPGAGKSVPVFAVIPKQKDNPVFSYAKAGALAKGRELGVEILWDGPERNDEVKQAQLVETFIRRGVDGIAISCSNPDVLRKPIDKAVAKGIPVVTWDSDSPRSARAAFFGVNDYQAGRLIAQELAALLQGKGTVALMSGVQGAQNLTLRLKGAKDVFAEKHPGIQVVTTAYCDDDVPKSVQLISSVMKEHPDLGGWGMVGGWALFARNGLNAVDPAKTKVVSVDPLPECWPWIEKGKAQVMIGQKVFDWGGRSVELLHKLHLGQPLAEADEKGFVDSGVDIVVLDKTKMSDPSRYISLAEYKQMFKAKQAAATAK